MCVASLCHAESISVLSHAMKDPVESARFEYQPGATAVRSKRTSFAATRILNERVAGHWAQKTALPLSKSGLESLNAQTFADVASIVANTPAKSHAIGRMPLRLIVHVRQTLSLIVLAEKQR